MMSVQFVRTMGGERVEVNGQAFGYIVKDGFFTDPTVLQNFLRMSLNDFHEIAERMVTNKQRSAL